MCRSHYVFHCDLILLQFMHLMWIYHSQVNVATANLNRGCFDEANNMYKEVLSSDGCCKTARKGRVLIILNQDIVHNRNFFRIYDCKRKD